jgi:hypothetical protein
MWKRVSHGGLSAYEAVSEIAEWNNQKRSVPEGTLQPWAGWLSQVESWEQWGRVGRKGKAWGKPVLEKP